MSIIKAKAKGEKINPGDLVHFNDDGTVSKCCPAAAEGMAKNVEDFYPGQIIDLGSNRMDLINPLKEPEKTPDLLNDVKEVYEGEKFLAKSQALAKLIGRKLGLRRTKVKKFEEIDPKKFYNEKRIGR